MIAHPLYGKRVKRSKKYQVHDEKGVKTGDRVAFVATAPVSKTKKWSIIEIVGDKKNNKKGAKAKAK